MKRLIPAFVASLAFTSMVSPVSAAAPGATEINGQKVLTMVVREPPGMRCNNNILVAAEMANLYKISVLVVPASLAPNSKAPAVYWGDQSVAEDGGEFNGMVSRVQLEDILEIDGVPKYDKQGLLLQKNEFEGLKSAVKGE